MAKRKGKAVKAAVKKNIRPLSISLFAVLLIMLAIPMGVNALDQEVVAASEETIVYSLDVADLTLPSGITGYGINETGDTNIIMLINNQTTGAGFIMPNIDWIGLGITKVVITVHENEGNLPFTSWLQCANTNGLWNAGTYKTIEDGLHVVGNYTVEFDYVDRVIYNNYDLMRITGATNVATWHSVANGSYISFNVDFYGIEDPIVPMNMLSDYVALFAGISLCVGAAFATPWLQVSDVSKTIKAATKPSRRPAKKAKKGGKK